MDQVEVQAVGVAIAGISAALALRTFHRGARTKSAEFLARLHEQFFVEKTYKKIRSILDDDSQSAADALHRLVNQETADFTDFLNFFELVAYMGHCRTLSRGDVEALLGYYLQMLTDKHELREYIHTKKKGFEYLDKLLSSRKAGV
jgi:hypothetical protein